MWNTGIIHSRESNILILNDDISLLPEHFEFDATRATSLLSESGVLTLNSSWSHFLINRECIKKIGWFDEHFVGIGNEDGEYAERYTNLTGNYIPTLMVHAFANISDSTRDLTVASTESKYSLFNSVLNQLRHDSPPTRPLINPYPMFDWRNRMAELLSVSDPSVVREAIKLELEKP
jgi:predicted glycosyltransferase involved in capsule biosynthesis